MSSCCSDDEKYTRTVLFKPGDYQSLYYRIPAIITAGDGSLVTMTDKRKFNEGDLPEDIDIVCRYSTDNGQTWSEPYTVAEGKGKGAGYGDAALVRTNNDNELMCVFVGGVGFFQSTPENSDRTYKCMSYDCGRTWTKPLDITDHIFGAGCSDSIRSKWKGAFVASGNGLLTSTGRIMFVLAVRDNPDDYLCSNYSLYSDDNGATWSVSQRASTGGDEAKVVELTNGDILMSIRHSQARWFNISKDGGVTWQPSTGTWPDLTAPACNGDIIRYPSRINNSNILLHSLPFGSLRSDVTVYASLDDGKTWPFCKCVVPYYSAYSSLCVLPDGTIGLYVEEREDDNKGYEMVFYRFGLDWLLSDNTVEH